MTVHGPFPLSRQAGKGPAFAAALGLHLAAAAGLAGWWQGSQVPGEPAASVELVPAPTRPQPVPAPLPPVLHTPIPHTPSPQPPAHANAARPTPRRPSAVSAPSPQAAEALPPAQPAPAATAAQTAPPATTAPATPPDRVPPTALDMSKPDYPLLARRRGWEGVVVLTVEVGADGAPMAVNVKAGSGHAVLDEAALDAARRWKFRPARDGGHAIAAGIDVPVRFSLAEE